MTFAVGVVRIEILFAIAFEFFGVDKMGIDDDSEDIRLCKSQRIERSLNVALIRFHVPANDQGLPSVAGTSASASETNLMGGVS